MKLWKRLTATAVALAMSASVWALAACGDPDQNNDDDPNQDNGGTVDGGNGDVGGNVDVAGEDVSAIVDALKGQELTTLIVNLNQTSDSEYVSKFTDPDDAYLDGYYTEEISYKATSNAKINLADGDMDIVAVYMDSVMDKDSYDEVRSSEHKKIDYAFMRSGYMFEYSSDPEEEPEPELVTDWSGITLECDGAATGFVPALGFIESYGSLANAVILNVASAADAVTLTEGKAEVDINKLAHNAIIDIYNALEGYTVNTTVGDVLQNGIIAKYLSSIFNIFTIDEVKGLLEFYLGESYKIVEPLFEAVQPDANSTTYEYVVKLVKSAGLKEFINAMIGESVLDSTLDNLTLGDIMQMITFVPGDDGNGFVSAVADTGDDVDYLALAREALGKLANKITATELKIEQQDMTVIVKSAIMEYALKSDNTIASQKLSLDFAMEGIVGGGTIVGSDGDLHGYDEFATMTGSVNCVIEYTSTKATLADISGCTLEQYEYKFADGVYTDTSSIWVWVDDYDCSAYVTLTGKITVENGDVAGICIEDEKGNVLTREEYAQFEIEVTVEDYDEYGQLTQITEPVELSAYVLSDYFVDGTLYWVELCVGDNCVVSADCQSVCFTNTVAGVLNGTPWTTVAD